MNKVNTGDLIQHSSLVGDLSEAQCNDLSLIASTRSLDDKEVLIIQGARACNQRQVVDCKHALPG